MLTRPYVKKRRMNYFGFGKKKRRSVKKRDIAKNKKAVFHYWFKAFKEAAKK